MKQEEKRPIVFALLILMLLLSIPFSVYTVFSGAAKYPILNIAVDVLLIGFAWGLWARNEVIRDIYVQFSVLVFLSLGVGLSVIISFVIMGKLSLGLQNIPGLMTMMSLLILVFYLRSEGLLRYYHSDE